ncbi:hypothetical protein GDO81_018334 [Engystomops pustulosus]|uniref:Uncharacterized protein n=1 Tax=Engystomops pustulosus TaxID=76066 RepID=A0AAV7ADF4_ENGPU|nr:hypothetical protein GDO81_018334 [Engystomops pustulosus]
MATLYFIFLRGVNCIFPLSGHWMLSLRSEMKVPAIIWSNAFFMSRISVSYNLWESCNILQQLNGYMEGAELRHLYGLRYQLILQPLDRG